MNEALRQKILRQVKAHRITEYCNRHKLARSSATRFALGENDTVQLKQYESAIREMIRSKEFDVNKWVKEGECDE